MDSYAWVVGDAIVSRFALALDSLLALDHFVRQSLNDIDDLVLRERIDILRGMCPAEWEQQRRDQEEYEERAAVMQLYAAFEGLLRRDAQWRGLEPAARFHTQFSATALKVKNGKFVRLSQWLDCWHAAILPVAGHTSAQISALSQIETTFVDDRNPLMHTDRAPSPPLTRVRQQLLTAYSSLYWFADDFGAFDA